LSVSTATAEVPVALDHHDPPKGRSRQIFRQAVHYFSGSGLGILSSIISYPLLTRLVSQRDYGTMTIVSSSVFLLVSFSKIGLQHSAVRFYPDFPTAAGNKSFLSTLLWFPVMNSAVLAVIVIATMLAASHWIADLSLKMVVLMAAPIVIPETALALLLTFMRAAKQASRSAVYYNISRYGQMFTSLGLLVLMRRRLVGFYIGWLAWDIVLLVVLFCGAASEKRIRVPHIDLLLLKPLLRFSAPLLFMEIGGNILTYGDRYVIAGKLGTSSTAIYSAAYNFTAAMQMLFVTTLSSFIFPWASEIWTNGSKEETEHFGSKVLDYFMVIAFPACLGVIALRREIMVIFASSKYSSASPLLPLLIVAQLSYGVYVVLTLGLFLRKRTVTMAVQLVFATAINIAANFVLIPRVGLMGAAWAMVASNSLLVLIAFFTSRRLLRIVPNWVLALKAMLSAAVMYLVVSWLPVHGDASRLTVGVICGAVTYGALIFMLDGDLRHFVTQKRS
jgi:O-antigen/teichoic acid export membrane protein